jgi:hypothetical protein
LCKKNGQKLVKQDLRNWCLFDADVMQLCVENWFRQLSGGVMNGGTKLYHVHPAWKVDTKQVLESFRVNVYKSHHLTEWETRWKIPQGNLETGILHRLGRNVSGNEVGVCVKPFEGEKCWWCLLCEVTKRENMKNNNDYLLNFLISLKVFSHTTQDKQI